MTINDLVPWKWGEKKVPVRREVEENPFYMMQREMDRLFNGFFDRNFEMTPFGESFGAFTPSVDVTENDKELTVSAELPGLAEKDIEVSLTRDVLTIRGEKKAEKEDKGDNYYRMERSYGSFQRSIPLPTRVDADKVDATFKNGVLTITLPKTEAQTLKKISIKS